MSVEKLCKRILEMLEIAGDIFGLLEIISLLDGGWRQTPNAGGSSLMREGWQR